MASASWSYDMAPRPFIPSVDVLQGRQPPRRQATHPAPTTHPRPPIPQGMFQPGVAPGMAGPVPMPRGMASQSSQVPPVPFPHPEHMPLHHHRLPPRPMGHGRSGSSAPAHDIVPPPEPTSLPRSTRTHVPEKIHVHIPVTQPQQQEKPATSTDKSPKDKALPKAPNPGGLGLFVATPVEPAPPASAPIPVFAPPPPPPPPPAPANVRRPAGVRRATVSECQRLPTPEAENDEFIQQEHIRQDQMWEEEQTQRQREIEEERRKYAEGRVRSNTVHNTHQRQKSVDSILTPPPDSPIMNEHGIPSPPPTMSPPTKALKRSTSTKDDRERWRVEIREAMDEQRRGQEEAKAAFEAAMQAEQERLRRENARRDRARMEAEAERIRLRLAQQQKQHLPPPPPRIYPEPAYPKSKGPALVKRSSKSQLRPRRKSQKDSGAVSSGRSADGYGRGATTASNWHFTRAKRYYGEGATDLREEGVKGQKRVEEDTDEEWQDIGVAAIEGGETPSYIKAAWGLYETGWKRLFDTPPALNSLRFMDIPWPSMESLPQTTNPRSPKGKNVPLPPTVLQISAVLNQKSIARFLLSPHHSSGKSSRSRLRAALLRFHPDKVARWVNLIQESERDAVVMGVEIVVRCLNELMRKASDEPVL